MNQPWKQTDGTRAAQQYEQLCRCPWYSLRMIRRSGRLDGDTLSLGPSLVDGVIVHCGGLIPGVYAVTRDTWLPRRRLSDWGSLTVHGPRRWVLRYRDSGRLILPNRDGEIVWIGRRGGEQWL